MSKTEVMVYTSQCKIKGFISVAEDIRLLDTVNARTASKNFLALTDVSIFDLNNGKVSHKTPFLAVNKDSISIIYPLNGKEPLRS